MALRGEDKLAVDTGIALRRYASHLKELDRARERKVSVLITPIIPGHTAHKEVSTPPDHEELRL
jgi:hypothetical protein